MASDNDSLVVLVEKRDLVVGSLLKLQIRFMIVPDLLANAPMYVDLPSLFLV